MQRSRRRPPPPWERNRPEPVHPIGRARRRWPHAYDGGTPASPPNVRYRRAFDGPERRSDEGPKLRRRSPSAIERIRRNPVRHGLIGLTIAGSAMPVAMARYAGGAARTDPSHEQLLGFGGGTGRISDSAVGNAWRKADQDTAARAESARDAKIRENMDRYASYRMERTLAERIHDHALKAGIDPDLAFGLVRTESTFKDQATSHVGAVGLTQLMPGTAKWIEPGVTTDDLRDSDTNLRIGFRYLKELMDKYDGDTRLALLAYNRGPGTVDRVLKKGGNPDNGYVEMVMKDITTADLEEGGLAGPATDGGHGE